MRPTTPVSASAMRRIAEFDARGRGCRLPRTTRLAMSEDTAVAVSPMTSVTERSEASMRSRAVVPCASIVRASSMVRSAIAPAIAAVWEPRTSASWWVRVLSASLSSVERAATAAESCCVCWSSEPARSSRFCRSWLWTPPTRPSIVSAISLRCWSSVLSSSVVRPAMISLISAARATSVSLRVAVRDCRASCSSVVRDCRVSLSACVRPSRASARICGVAFEGVRDFAAAVADDFADLLGAIAQRLDHLAGALVDDVVEVARSFRRGPFRGRWRGRQSRHCAFRARR